MRICKIAMLRYKTTERGQTDVFVDASPASQSGTVPGLDGIVGWAAPFDYVTMNYSGVPFLK